MSSTFNSAISYVVSIVDEVNARLSKVTPVWLVIGSVGGTLVFIKVRRLVRFGPDIPLHKRLATYGFSWIRLLPGVRKKLEVELDTTKQYIMESLHKCDPELNFIREIPAEPLNISLIIDRADHLITFYDVKRGRVSGTCYSAMEEGHLELLTEIFKKFVFSNALHPDVFPSLRKMEAEVVRMVLELFHGPESACGTVTSGGTESLILACLASRNLAISKGVSEPILVVPKTAHAAFDKAANLLGIRIKHVALKKGTLEVDVKAMESAITSETCLLVGSAPNFPFGTVDNIPEIAKLGEKYNIPVHVDACLGGFLVAFAEQINLNIPIFDFRLRGVTSISCDTHKYAMAPKGTSIIMYRSNNYIHHQYSSITTWPGGIYATPTLAGSRAGLNIALTWATLLHYGHADYVMRAKKIVTYAKLLADSISKLPGIEIVGRPDVSIVAFRSTNSNIYKVSELLNKLGWHLNTCQNPASIHFCVTYNQTSEEVILAFVEDLKSCLTQAQLAPSTEGLEESPTASIYGIAGNIPLKSVIDEVTYIYMDSCYSMPLNTLDFPTYKKEFPTLEESVVITKEEPSTQ